MKNNNHSHIQEKLCSLADQIEALLRPETDHHEAHLQPEAINIRRLADEYFHINAWFNSVYIRKSFQMLIAGLKAGLKPELIERTYPNVKTIAFIINPGAPFEGIGEVFFAAINGFSCLVKVPADCKELYESLIAYVGLTLTEISGNIKFFSDRLPPFDGIVGLNAFEGSGAVSYITKKPNLLIYQKGCTVTLAGNETIDQLRLVSEGICDFYGRSFFSIKSLLVPGGYDFSALFQVIEEYQDNSINHRYFNHYEYHKALMLINDTQHLDNGFILLTSDGNQSGKTGVVTYTDYMPDQQSEILNQSPMINKRLKSFTANQYFINGRLPDEKKLFYNSAKLADFLSGL